MCQDVLLVFFFPFQYFITAKKWLDYNWEMQINFILPNILLSVYNKHKKIRFSEELDNIVNNTLLLWKIKNPQSFRKMVGLDFYELYNYRP